MEVAQTRPDQTGLGTGPASLDRTGPEPDQADQTGPDRAGLDRTRPDGTGPTRLDWTRLETHRGAPMGVRGAPVKVFKQKIR